MMQFMNDFAVNFQTSLRETPQQPIFRPTSAATRAQGMLTTQVWPKSRMLFAVVSKMSKEGLLTEP